MAGRGSVLTEKQLLKVVQPGKLLTHRFALHDAMKAYDSFSNAAAGDALKVVLKR